MMSRSPLGEALNPAEIRIRKETEEAEDKARQKNPMKEMTAKTRAELIAKFEEALSEADLSEAEAKHTLEHFQKGSIARLLLAPLTHGWRNPWHSHHADAVRKDAEARGRIRLWRPDSCR